MTTSDIIRREDRKCVKCGACRAGCPVFFEVRSEGASARGKMSLAAAQAAGGAGATRRFREEMSRCLLCLACVDTCPNGVRIDDAVIASRSLLFEGGGGSLALRALFRGLLPSGSVLSHGLAAAAVLQHALFERAEGGEGMHRRIPLPGVPRDRLVPELAPSFFLEGVSGEDAPEPGAAPAGEERVGFFAGCMINYFYPEIGRKTVDLIRRAGGRPVVPPGQVCCGLPALGSGDLEGARALARANLEAFERAGVGRIVSSCASCGSTLKEYYPRLMAGGDPDLSRRMAAFSSAIRDVSEYLVERGVHPRTSDLRATYHDPCHLRRGMGVRDAPRILLEGALGAGLVEMANPCRCCGFGGSFSFAHRDLSLRVLERKVVSILRTGAEAVVTGCPGCMMNLRDGLARAGSSVQVRHLVDVLG